MPSSYVHLWVAGSLATGLVDEVGGSAGSGSDLGSGSGAGSGAGAGDEDLLAAFFAGSVVADVGLIAGPARAATHYWAPGDDAGGRVGAARLLAAHPQLAAGRLNGAARAYVAGYLCHLATDEHWIGDIFERYFGPLTPYAAGAEGQALQQALYTVIEQRRGAPGAELETALAALGRAVHLPLREDLPPFTAAAGLRRFLEAQLAFAALPPGAERYRLWQRLRTLPDESAPSTPPAAAPPPAYAASPDAFLERLPDLEARAAVLVPEAEVEQFHCRAVAACRALLREYLAERPLMPAI